MFNVLFWYYMLLFQDALILNKASVDRGKHVHLYRGRTFLLSTKFSWKRYFILQPSSQSAVFVNKPNLFFPFAGFGRCLVYRKQTCLLKRYANQVILYSHLMSTKPINTARLFSVCVFVSLLPTNHENTKRVTKLLRSLGDIKWLLLPLKLLKKLARRINSLSSALIVIKGLNLATQQVIVAGNTIVVTHLVLFSFFISLLNTWM